MKITWSRISQVLFLATFFVLFVLTEYRGKDIISAAINSFFRADPLVAVSYLLSQKTFTVVLLPGILMVLFTVILGRFFCGWLCPLGTILDLVTRYIPKKKAHMFSEISLQILSFVLPSFCSVFQCKPYRYP